MITVPNHTRAFTRNCYGRRVVDILMSIRNGHFGKKDMYQGQLLYSNNGGRKDAFLCATPTITTTLWFYSISLIVMFRFRDIRLHVI